MRKLFGQTLIASAKNGEINIHYRFGKPALFVDGFDQSTEYTGTMWRKALRHLPKDFVAAQILMLGLGGGSAIKSILKRFPDCQLTVVEWDPVMIKLYRELYGQDQAVTIIEGDATVVVPAMKETFDLVLVDLFKGNETPKELASAEFVQAIACVTSPTGYCLLNAFVSSNLLPIFAKHFTQAETWKYRYNTLASYQR